MSAMIPFSFDGAEVRVSDQGGEPWFVLADVCAVLELVNSRNVTARLDDDEKGVCIVDTLGGPQEATIINESGLWSLVLTSRKPEAKRFKRWITSEVIPAIRKTGGYGRDPMVALSDPESLRGLLLAYSEKVLTLEAENKALLPKAEALDRIATADGSLCITDAAKTLQQRPKDLFQFLQAHGWIYSRQGGGDVAYQVKLQQGLLEHKTTEVRRSDGSEKVTTQVRVTPKGLTRLAKEFPPPLYRVA